jgi:hypothetical protein
MSARGNTPTWILKSGAWVTRREGVVVKLWPGRQWQATYRGDGPTYFRRWIGEEFATLDEAKSSAIYNIPSMRPYIDSERSDWDVHRAGIANVEDYVVDDGVARPLESPREECRRAFERFSLEERTAMLRASRERWATVMTEGGTDPVVRDIMLDTLDEARLGTQEGFTAAFKRLMDGHQQAIIDAGR